VRLISEKEDYLGIFPLEKALSMAQKEGLDLVEISPKANPPVCKIIDYGKFSYQERKKKQKEAKKTHQSQLKSIRLSFSISDHDLEVRTKSAKKFLLEGDKVRIVLPLRGRENALKSVAEEKIKKLIEKVEEEIPLKIEKPIGKEPRGLTMIISKKI